MSHILLLLCILIGAVMEPRALGESTSTMRSGGGDEHGPPAQCAWQFEPPYMVRTVPN